MKANQPEQITIQYDRGTLAVSAKQNQNLFSELPWLQWDKRTNCFRCHGYQYRNLIRHLYYQKVRYSDFTPKYQNLKIQFKKTIEPYDYQQEALSVWAKSKRGITVLPTGAGKSFLAALAIGQVQRSTLVLVPTIDLMLQWQKNLFQLFQQPIGLLGGGSYEIEEITVSTYESARIKAEQLGNRFCFLIFDECHHLPSPANTEMARSYIAPYRLGLTATPVTDQERVPILTDIAGPIVYTKDISQLSGEYLAPYTIESIRVELTEDERELYDYHRGIYLDFRSQLVGLRNKSWEQFVIAASRTSEGRQAIRSFNIQKQLAIAAKNKLEELAKIFVRHQKERILIFTNDNKTAYLISSLFMLPLITHETKAKERKEVLDKFRNGEWPFLVNSRVLNEGVDVPEATVAVIISGTSTVREHVQRLGRILRKKDNNKTATLYEMITENTGEVFTSKRRREHKAYEKFS
ncbi:MAG: superfamily II DNA or RNA helicase [bacterium]|jgi:superfamily II DNA or RNA helicase